MSIKVCPLCKKSGGLSVIDSRSAGNGEASRRRYKCGHCRDRFTTFEVHVERTVKHGVSGRRDHSANLGRIAADRILDDALVELNFEERKP